MSKVVVALMLAAALVVAWAPAQHASAAPKIVRVTLIDENGSGEDGSAQLTDQGDGTTKVQLIMLNAPDGAVQPAHIHEGSCATLNPTPKYPLNNVVDGKSTTVVKASLADLTAEHFAINVHKSAAEVAVYVSCGNLPLASLTSGPLDYDAALSALLDQAGELDATIQKKEADASSNAYNLYHTLFATNEDTIKARSADLQASLDDAMTAVKAELDKGDWDGAHTAAQALMDKIKAAQAASTGSGSSSGASMTSVMNDLTNAAADLVRETGNKDADGAQAAYNEFHTAFAAHEDDIRAKAPDETAEMEAAQAEVSDALKAGDWTKAASSAKEIQQSVKDAIGTMGLTTSTLPTTGNSSQAPLLLLLGGLALALVGSGTALRRRLAR